MCLSVVCPTYDAWAWMGELQGAQSCIPPPYISLTITPHLPVVHSVWQRDVGICEIHKEFFKKWNEKYKFLTIYFYNLVIWTGIWYWRHLLFMCGLERECECHLSGLGQSWPSTTPSKIANSLPSSNICPKSEEVGQGWPLWNKNTSGHS